MFSETNDYLVRPITRHLTIQENTLDLAKPTNKMLCVHWLKWTIKVVDLNPNQKGATKYFEKKKVDMFVHRHSVGYMQSTVVILYLLKSLKAVPSPNKGLQHIKIVEWSCTKHVIYNSLFKPCNPYCYPCCLVCHLIGCGTILIKVLPICFGLSQWGHIYRAQCCNCWGHKRY